MHSLLTWFWRAGAALALLALVACGQDGPDDQGDDTAAPGCVPQEEICNGLDDDCDSGIDEGVQNVCGGCAELDPPPLGECGPCGGGTVICATPNDTVCVNEAPQNPCGGCLALPRRPGEFCGTCDTGVIACDGEDGVVCEGADDNAFNVCGGCRVLEQALGSPCGVCDTGFVECDGAEAQWCVGDQGDEALNLCGLCGPLPEEGCGICGDGVQIDGEACDDGNNVDMDGCSASCELELAVANIEPGSFIMGSPVDERGRNSSEFTHRVDITVPFIMRAEEVTREEWEAVMGMVSPSLFDACGPRCPVTRVSWYDAVFFANQLSAEVGLTPCYALEGCDGEPGAGCPDEEVSCTGGFSCESVVFAGLSCDGWRLPTEAEWEYAARAGTSTAFSSGDIVFTSRNPLDPSLDSVGWYAGNSSVTYEGGQDCEGWFEGADFCGPQPVGGKLPNAWGVFDMHGNAWEWVWDYGGDYIEAPQTDPLGPMFGDSRVRRGGSWSSPSQFCRSAFRFANDPTFRANGLGFRLVRSAL